MSTIATTRIYTVKMRNIRKPSTELELTFGDADNCLQAEQKALDYAEALGFNRLGWNISIGYSI